MELNYSVFRTAAGWIAALANTDGLLTNTLPQDTEQQAFSLLEIKTGGARFQSDMFTGLQKKMVGYFKGAKVTFPERLDMSAATTFQREVWQATRTIPYGETRSYKWLAEKIGRPKATRAVGGALGKNPLPIIVPCHRVIGSNGGLVGFTGGLDVKIKLLELEGAIKKR
jgi:methylated-DNA-[protein]-cysteine S-methyltransferase